MSRQTQARAFYEREVEGDAAWPLCRGVRGLLRCDGAEVVEGIARYVMSQHRGLRAGSDLMERRRGTRLPSAAALAGAAFRFLEVRPRGGRDGAVWIARLGNERRALEALPRLLPDLNWNEWTFRARPDISALPALVRGVSSARRIVKLARRLHRRYEFFKVLRAVELLGYYARYLRLFRTGRFRIAVMSSHSNPHGIAFNLAARNCGVPVVLITHGMPVRPVARLSYDLAVVHCEAARQTYLEEGCRMNRVLIHGRRQHYAPMPGGPFPERLTVGIFLSKDVNEERLRAVTQHLLGDPRVARIFLRPHPKNLWTGFDEWIAAIGEQRLRRSPGVTVFSDIGELDIVLAGNSSVLVDAVTAGRPSGYVPGLDYGSQDLHEFVARGLIYPIDEEFSFDPDAMLRFYQRRDWPNALRLFANIDEDEAAVTARVCATIRDLAVSLDQPPT